MKTVVLLIISNIFMEKYNSQLRDSESFNGTVLYKPGAGRNASVRIDWKSPQQEVIAVSNGKFKIYRPRLGQVIEGDSRKQPKASGILEMMYLSRQQLEAKFQPLQDVREETLWGGISTIHLTLVPKGNAGYKYAEIWIDNSGMFPFGSRTSPCPPVTLLIKNVKRNFNG